MKHIGTIALIALAIAVTGIEMHFDGETRQTPYYPPIHTPDDMDAAIMCSQAGCRFEEAAR